MSLKQRLRGLRRESELYTKNCQTKTLPKTFKG